jgi:hypothetical protein
MHPQKAQVQDDLTENFAQEKNLMPSF